MSENAQPTVQILVIDEADLMAAFGDAVSNFAYMSNKPLSPGAFYFAAHKDGDLVSLAKMHSYASNEYLAFVEVREDQRRQGVAYALRDVAFKYAAEHTGEILLPVAQEMGKEHLPRQTEALQKKYPALTILRQQNG